MSSALIVDAVRSPIGRKNGTLSHIRGDELSAQGVNGLIGRNDVDPAEIEELQWGCVSGLSPIGADVRSGDDGGGAAALVRTRFGVGEAIRETTLEKMAQLQPAFIPDGVVTAGNSSQIVDGSAAVLIASEEKASKLGLEPRARFLGFGIAGVDPHMMLHGNPEACERALARADLTWDDMAVIEVNEAFP